MDHTGKMTVTSGDIAARNLEAVKNRVPLVHAITNYVSMGWVADVISALGASPIMADDAGEVDEVTPMAGALALNLGTLNPGRLEGITKAAEKATTAHIPMVLDPVGAGAITTRTDAAVRILKHTRVNVIRANASEMLALAGQTSQTRGVDALHPVEAARAAAGQLALQYNLIAVVTGAEDLVAADDQVFRVASGHPLMGRVSGTGCALGAVIGAFLAVESDPLNATLSALACFNLAGEMAAAKTASPGSFKTVLVDALDAMTPAMIRQGARITDGDNA